MGRPLWRLSALELGAAVRSGAVTALEVVEEHLARLGTVNPRVHAVTTVFADTARAAARDIDIRRAEGRPLGPFAGVPFTVKENIDVAGSATTHGVPALRHAVAPADAPIVERLRQAGAIPLAHTNLPDLSLRFHTRSQLYGDTVNPWNAEYSPGGSSGGEGVALATGMSPLGLGNDAGGSVRLPALFGGVAALKPSYGRFPSDRSVGPRDATLCSQLIPVEGVLARSVADLRAACQVLQGPDPRDPRAVPAPFEGPALPSPLRVAVSVDPGEFGDVHPDVAAAVELAATALRDAGYVVEYRDVPRVAETVSAYGHMIMTEFSLARSMLERLLGAEGRRYIELATIRLGPVSLEEYLRLTSVRQGIVRDWAEFLARYPVVVGPIFTQPAARVGEDIESPDAHARIADAMRLSTITSFVGVPAVAVPVGVAHGLPQGVQLISGFFREDLGIAAAEAIEARVGRITPID